MIDLAGKVFINRSVSIKETKETGKLFKELKSLYEKYGVLLNGKMMLELASESWDKENY